MDNNENSNRYLITALLFSVSWVFTGAVTAQEAPPATEMTPATVETAPYSDKGADTCAKCHDEDSEFPVFSIFKTKHATRADKRTPFAGKQCEACHGPGGKHAEKVRPGQKQAPIISFGSKSTLNASEQNQICLGCHQGGGRLTWHGSEHERGDVACAACHTIHAARDRVLVKPDQPEVCYRCHRQVRAEFLKPSAHPVRLGQLGCTDCHNTHGTLGPDLLAKPTLNQTCYTCHAEKRGPLLWEHAPVPENCALCHLPHGSIQPALLNKRPPLLCQQCHSAMGHPSIPQTGGNLPGGTPTAFLLSGGCINCHSQVHGSNHPSGARLMR